MREPFTLLFTDIEAFTAQAASEGDDAAVTLLDHHDHAVLPALRRHRGAILKRLGDGLMAVFGTPTDAVRAALEMQWVAARRGRVRLRIGIHAGEARVREGDLIGHDVNVAALIGERAGGGQIVISDVVRQAACGLPARFREGRTLALPGRAPIRLFRVHGSTVPDVGRPTSHRVWPLPFARAERGSAPTVHPRARAQASTA